MLLTLLTAQAGPLMDLARVELDNAREIHRSVRTAQAAKKFELSKECLTAHEAGGTQMDAARALYDAGKKEAAYDGMHATLLTLKPCALDLAGGSKSFQLSIKAMLRTSEEALTAADAFLAKDGKGREAYGKAVAAKTTSRSKATAGDMKPATEDWYTMLGHIEAAVKAER